MAIGMQEVLKSKDQAQSADLSDGGDPGDKVSLIPTKEELEQDEDKQATVGAKHEGKLVNNLYFRMWEITTTRSLTIMIGYTICSMGNRKSMPRWNFWIMSDQGTGC
jgi:hypothetical protein